MTPKRIHEFIQTYAYGELLGGPQSVNIPLPELRDLCYTALKAAVEAEAMLIEAKAAAVAEERSAWRNLLIPDASSSLDPSRAVAAHDASIADIARREEREATLKRVIEYCRKKNRYLPGGLQDAIRGQP